MEMKNYIMGAGGCLITKSLLNNETTLKWIYREDNNIGNGWVAFGKDDSEEYVNDASNLTLVDFNTLANIEPAVLNIYEMPYGSDLEFISDDTGKYFIDTNTRKVIREKVKSPLQIAFEENLIFRGKEQHSVEFMQSYFSKSNKIEPFVIGEIDFPTGEIIIADPLVYLHNEQYSTILNRGIAPGSYPVELSILHSDIAGVRVAAAKLKVTEQNVVKYELAMPKGYTIEQLNEPGILAGFGVDAGLGSFCDAQVAREYTLFLDDWHKENSEKNHYYDYFQKFFNQSYLENPNVQRPDGDFLIWNNPNTNHRLSMFASGMGDGFYSGFWGLDENDEVCELIIPFMNPELF